MTDVFKDLDQSFVGPLTALLQSLRDEGYAMIPYAGLRSPLQQAKDWRQSRSTDTINIGVSMLLEHGCHFLASQVLAAGPQYGRKVTNALPGLSWHQYGLAVDVYWLVDNEAVWTGEGYDVLHQVAHLHGLTTLEKIGDNDHIQLPPEAAPDKVYSWHDIDAMMKQKFS